MSSRFTAIETDLRGHRTELRRMDADAPAVGVEDQSVILGDPRERGQRPLSV